MALTLAVSCSVYDSSLLSGGGHAGGPALLSGGAPSGGDGAGGSVVNGGSAGRAENASSDAGEAGATAEGGTVGQGGSNGAGKAGTEAGVSGTSGDAGKGGSSGHAGSAGASASGAGGTAGAGGSAGGSAGNTGGGPTSGGSGGATGAGGSGGAAVVTANGCASLSVPLTASTHKAHFVISLSSNTNFSAASISLHVYVKAGMGGVIASYVQDSSFILLVNSKPTELNTVSGWQTLTWNVGAQGAGTTGINLSGVYRIGIEINAAPDTAWSNPTLVYIDSITVTSPALSFSFDTSGTVNTTPQNGDIGSQVMWENAYSGDTSASNVALGWLPSCP